MCFLLSANETSSKVSYKDVRIALLLSSAISLFFFFVIVFFDFSQKSLSVVILLWSFGVLCVLIFLE